MCQFTWVIFAFSRRPLIRLTLGSQRFSGHWTGWADPLHSAPPRPLYQTSRQIFMKLSMKCCRGKTNCLGLVVGRFRFSSYSCRHRAMCNPGSQAYAGWAEETARVGILPGLLGSRWGGDEDTGSWKWTSSVNWEDVLDGCLNHVFSFCFFF